MIFRFFLFFAVIPFSYSIFAQEDCKVLVPELDSIYFGKCKKGLAHGKGEARGVDSYIGKFSKGWPNGTGTYTWANGDYYEGGWKEGKRHGEGILVLKKPKGDSLVDGLWEDDDYMGPKPKPPVVIAKTGIERYSIRKNGDIKNRVLIDFLQSGSRNTSIYDIRFSTSSGSETKLGHSIGYEFIVFPVTIRVSYKTQNKLRTVQYDAVFEFKISEPGDWKVELHN